MRRSLAFMALSWAVLCPAFSQAASLTAEQKKDALEFTVANTAFTLYHEAAHAMISTLSLPVIGREEDAADMFAASVMIPKDGGDDTRDKQIMDAIDGFALTDGLAGEAPGEEDYMDSHGLDTQRYYQLACLLYGSDSDGFTDYANEVGLTEDRLASCPEEYQQATKSWERLLAPFIPKGGPANSFTLRWSPSLQAFPWTQKLQREKALDPIIAELNRRVILPRPVTITVTSCDDEPNAWWDPEDKSITLCPELLELYGETITQALQDGDGEDSSAPSAKNSDDKDSKSSKQSQSQHLTVYKK